jgi:homoserine dehydrogenase
LARLLLRKQTELEARYGITYSVVGLATGRHGRAFNPNGLDLAQALSLIESKQPLNPLSTQTLSSDPLAWIRETGADALFENTPVDYETGQPAIDHLRTTLEAGMHAVTANKGPVVHAYDDLRSLAESRGVKFYFESAVMDGAPIFALFRSTLPGARLESFQGVLNSTTNLILTRMEAGETFDQAVAYAQSIGIAETDPSGDVDGWDAAIKVAALATVLMEVPLKPADVQRQGIGGLTPADIQKAQEAGQRWKLVCAAERDGEGVSASVGPQLVSPDSALFGVEGTSSIVQFETDVLGTLAVREDNPGPDTTAYGLLADFLNAVRGT